MKHLAHGVLLLIAMFFISCSNPQSKIDRISNDLTSAEQNSGKLSDKELESISADLGALQTDLDKNRDDYSDAQIKEIGKLKGRYASLVAKNSWDGFKRDVKDAASQVKGFVEGFMEEDTTK
jgi:hypothetical protein